MVYWVNSYPLRELSGHGLLLCICEASCFSERCVSHQCLPPYLATGSSSHGVQTWTWRTKRERRPWSAAFMAPRCGLTCWPIRSWGRRGVSMATTERESLIGRDAIWFIYTLSSWCGVVTVLLCLCVWACMHVRIWVPVSVHIGTSAFLHVVEES